MKCYRTGHEAIKTVVLGLVLAIGTTVTAATIEVDGDGGEALVIDNIATNAQNLAVGTDNAGNSLTITNSGSVTVVNASVGSTDIGDNSILVTGSNSFLQAQSSLNIGTASGSEGNQLIVADNGSVFVGDLNSNLPAGGAISVGSTNETATLSIGSGSQVEADNLLVGTQSNATGSVSLTGADATLSLSNDLLLGTVSSNNSINVANGASLTIGNDLLIGSTNTSGNQLTIGNGGSVVIEGTTTINNPSNNVINVNSGGHLGLSQGLDLDSENDGFNIAAGASLELGGTLEADKLDYNIDITLTGSGTTWISTNTHMYIGDKIDGNSLTLKDGASITNGTGKKLYVGNDSDANSLIISGTNTTLVAQGETFIGSKGSQNTLTIENGGSALMHGTLKIGNITTANSNIVNVFSNGTLVANNDIVVGAQGNDNSFNIQDGQVGVDGDFILGSEGMNNRYDQIGGTNTVAGEFIIGMTEKATGKTGFVDDDRVETTGNLAIVGSNATLNVGQDLTVGMQGGGSIVTIRDGGIVNVDGDVIIGEAVGDNYIYLQRDADTRLNVSGDLVVGVEGGSNRFAEYGGTANIGGNLFLGASTNQHEIKNFIHLETTNAVLNVANGIYIGASNSVNTMDIVGGASANVYEMYVGTYEGVSNNVVTVTGEDSLLNITNILTIGSATGTNNQIIVENGGLLIVDQTNIVINGTNNNLNIANGGTLQSIDWNAATADKNIVLGAGSTLELGGAFSGTNRIDGSYELLLNGSLATNMAQWNTGSDNMFVGYASDGSTLTIQNGAMAATDSDLIVGRSDKTTGNELHVIGSGSLTDVGNNLLIGRNGSSNNRLTIEEGGQVDVDHSLTIGANSKNNTAAISSLSNTVSTLNIGNALIIGQGATASGNHLEIGDYASVTVGGSVTIGATGAREDSLQVEGTNSVLNIGNALIIGQGATASGNNLEIGDNASITVGGSATIGAEGARNGSLQIAGTNSVLSIGTNLVVGTGGGSGNELLIENGGQASVGQNMTIGNQAGNNSASITGLTNAASTLQIGTSLTIGKGANASGNHLEIGDNANVTIGGSATIGATGARNGSLQLTGTNSFLSIGTNLVVGTGGGSGNELLIENGGQASVGKNMIIGNQAGNNKVKLSGLTNAVSTLDIGEDLTIGKGTGASGNSMEISDDAVVTLSGLATIGDNAGNNLLELTADTAMINALTNFVIGAGDATGNELSVTAGNAIIAGDLMIGKDEGSTGNIASISGTNAMLQVLADLYVGNDGSENSMTISDGGMVEGANAYLGFTTNSHNNALSIAGTNSSLTIAGTLYAGYKGDDNSIDISDGARLQVTDAHIGYDSIGNKIDVYGTNSVFAVLNDLFIGNAETNANGHNELWVYENAITTVGGNLTMQSNSTLYIDAGSQVKVTGNYSQDESSVLALRISTNSISTNLTVGATASFAKDTTFKILDDDTVVGTTNNVSRALVAANTLEIDEQMATQDLLNDSINIVNDLLKFNLILSNNVIWVDNVTRLSLAETSGLEPGSQLANVADDIDFMADSSNEVAVTMRDFMDTELDSTGRNAAFHNYYGEKMSSTPAHNAINIGVQSVSEQLTRRADSTRARMGMASASGPDGAGGPHTEGQPFQGWVAGYKTWANKSADSGFDGYDGSIGGFLVGADISVAQGILMGIAGGKGNSTLDKDNGASSDTDSVFGSVYLSAGTKDWFADASLIYGGSSIDTVLGSTFDTTASYDAQNTAIYFGGGKEITGNYLIITPQASLLANYYKQDGYEERSSNAVGRQVGSFDTLYLQSELGCNVGFYAALGSLTLKPEFRASWMHEFNAQDENVSFNLIGGTNPYVMTLQAKEEDIIRLGAGLSAKIGEYLELRADLDTRRGSNYSDHTLLGSLRYQF